MKRSRVKKEKLTIPSALADDQPATRKLLWLVRDELKSEIKSENQTLRSDLGQEIGRLRSDMNTRLSALEDKFSGLQAKVDSMDSRFEAKFEALETKFDSKFDSKFGSIEAKIQSLQTDIIRMNILTEEQNANNRIVLEGLQALWQRQDRIETKSDPSIKGSV